jgi:hypothetical protein
MNPTSMAMQALNLGGGGSGNNQPKNKISGYNTAQLPNFTPEMMNLFQSLLGNIGGGANSGIDYLSKLAGGDEEAFGGMEQNAMNQFEKFLGQAGTRFSDLGAQDSSYFENAVSGAGSELTQNLQSQRNKMRQEAIESLLSNSQQLLGRNPYQNFLAPKQQKQGFDWGGLAQSAVGAIPSIIGLL